jgi:hypothetical protein
MRPIGGHGGTILPNDDVLTSEGVAAGSHAAGGFGRRLVNRLRKYRRKLVGWVLGSPAYSSR